MPDAKGYVCANLGGDEAELLQQQLGRSDFIFLRALPDGRGRDGGERHLVDVDCGTKTRMDEERERCGGVG
jgi:hypothetical protein